MREPSPARPHAPADAAASAPLRSQSAKLSACISPIAISGLVSVPRIVTVSVLTVPSEFHDFELETPRGSVPPGSFFQARYRTMQGARRVVVQAVDVRQLPGLRDLVRAKLVSDPQEAGERQSPRETVNQPVKGVVLQSGSAPQRAAFDGRIADISVLGIAFEAQTKLQNGDRVVLAHPEAGASSAAEIEVIHAGLGDGSRIGARFADASAGHRFFGVVMELETAARTADRDDKVNQRRATIMMRQSLLEKDRADAAALAEQEAKAVGAEAPKERHGMFTRDEERRAS